MLAKEKFLFLEALKLGGERSLSPTIKKGPSTNGSKWSKNPRRQLESTAAVRSTVYCLHIILDSYKYNV